MSDEKRLRDKVTIRAEEVLHGHHLHGACFSSCRKDARSIVAAIWPLVEPLASKQAELEAENQRLEARILLATTTNDEIADRMEQLQRRLHTDNGREIPRCLECGQLWPCATWRASKGEHE